LPVVLICRSCARKIALVCEANQFAVRRVGKAQACPPMQSCDVMVGIETIGFSIRAPFDNFICDAVHGAVKLRSARFDCSLCLHRRFGFRLRQIGGKHAGAVFFSEIRFFGNHMHHTQAVCLGRQWSAS
jgi:hypothetical protein